VTLHDGARLTADDVIFSLDRPATLLRSPAGAIIPPHFQATTWAARHGIAIVPRTDERIFFSLSP